MDELKACFGRCANLEIYYRDMSKKHFLRMDEEKLAECNECPLFARCMFQRYNKLFSEILEAMDTQDQQTRPRLG